MKPGDVVLKIEDGSFPYAMEETGIVIEITPTTHAKQWPRVVVLTDDGLQNWIIQHCEVVSESR